MKLLSTTEFFWSEERDRLRPISTSANFDFGQFFLDHKGWGARRKGAPKGWGPEGCGAQNFALFFFPFPSQFSFFSLSLSLSLGSFRGILVVFEAPGPWRFHTTAREPKRAQFRVPAFENAIKIQRKDPKERKKNENHGGRTEKKSKFWAVPRRVVRRRVVRRRVGPAEGSILNGVQGWGFRGFGFSSGFWDKNRNRTKTKRRER